MGTGREAEWETEWGFDEGAPVRAHEARRERCEESTTDQWRARWLAAVRWRRRVEAALAPAQLTFTQWQVLEATHELIMETGDAVSQSQVAARTELDRSTISQVMRALDRKHLVSRAPCFIGTSLRVFLSGGAEELLEARRGAIEAASNG